MSAEADGMPAACAAGEERAGRVLFWDRNSTVHLAFLALTGVAAWRFGWWGLLAYPALQLLSDVLYYRFAVDVFDPSLTIARGYELSLSLIESPHSQGLDYGFNFYDGDYGKSREQAQRDKFEYAFDLLELEPGMRLIDVGCGCGDWLAYLRDRGLSVAGVNITRAQVEVCRQRGLEVHHTDWKTIPETPELRDRLYGRFDRVTCWDTVEHYVPMKHRADTAARDAIYRRLFELARALLRDESGRLFISCLHMRNQVRIEPRLESLYKVWYCYILDKFHSGCYPSGERDCLVLNARPYFTLASRKDCTLDYYMTSKLEESHFGRHRFRWTPRRAAAAAWTVIADPFWLHRLIWFLSEDWMFQFDAEDIDDSDVVLWWLSFRVRGAVVG